MRAISKLEGQVKLWHENDSCAFVDVPTLRRVAEETASTDEQERVMSKIASILKSRRKKATPFTRLSVRAW